MSANIFCLSTYPESNLIVELNSHILPHDLIDRLDHRVNKLAKKHMGQPHLILILDYLVSFIQDNLLLSAWKEMEKIKSELLTPGDSFRVNEKTGQIKIKIVEGRYRITFVVVVPDDYPKSSASIQLGSNNFPGDLMEKFNLQLEAFKVHVEHGSDWERLLQRRSERTKRKKREIERVPNKQDVLRMKEDVGFLDKLAAYQEVSDDKKMRRQKVRMVRKETATELQEAQQEEIVESIITYESLYPLTYYVFNNLGRRLPNETCKVCNERMLSEVPTKKSSTHEFERLLCGDWYHRECLIQYLQQPPFDGKVCIQCNEPISHQLFNENFIKDAEKDWLLAERKRAELAEVEDFLGLGF
eukprot:TRINITY_DN1655_c0_g1_i1.p1 TRINITY_DN1655_c0_g1~~TRINITY_DN1655_c0_g1_i1.p1  ORF type:complete len:400 (-),score=79.78 TRINITY_DN1655_c0_g1_i1:27-1097(-)